MFRNKPITARDEKKTEITVVTDDIPKGPMTTAVLTCADLPLLTSAPVVQSTGPLKYKPLPAPTNVPFPIPIKPQLSLSSLTPY